MDPYSAIELILLLCLFAAAGFFSSSEASLFSLTPLHLHKMRVEKSKRFPAVQRLLQYPRRLLITIIAGSESANVMISALAAAVFIRLLGDEGKWVSILILTPLLLIVGEAVPKTIAKINPITVSQRIAPLLTAFSKVFSPLVLVLEGFSGSLIRPFKGGEKGDRDALTEEELRVLVDAGHKEGVLEKTHRDLIHRVFDLGDTSVEDIMTPRTDMFCLPLALSPGEMKKEVLRNGYSRVPVYGSDRDDILGILYAKDLLPVFARRKQDPSMWSLLRKPYFIPLEKRADSLLRDFQMRKIHLAIVVDEYGGVEGLVTMEDILESLFGDIYDERDRKEDLYRVIDDRTIVAWGRMPIEDFNAVAGTNIPSEDFETIGGFVFHLIGRLPVKDEEVRFDGRVFRVERMRRARVWRVRVTREEGGPLP